MEITATRLAHIEQMLQTEEARYTAFKNSGYDKQAEYTWHKLHGMISVLNEFGFDTEYDENMLVHIKPV